MHPIDKSPIFLLALCLSSLALSSCTKNGAAAGPYLGQTPPGDEPELFAPGIVSTGLSVRDITMTPDGKEIYFTIVVGNYDYTTIACSRMRNGHWTEPEVASFADDPRYRFLESHISPDGQRFFFMSNRPGEGQEARPGWAIADIWVMDRTDNGWGEPYNLGSPVSSSYNEYFPSVTRDGTIYFTREIPGQRTGYIYRSRLVDGRYTEPEKLGPEVNSTPYQYNAFIAPDESYIIFSTGARKDGFGRDDYYICFRSADDTWTEPINLGDKINSPRGSEYSPYVSPDGRYFFFSATRPRDPEKIFGDQVTYARIREHYSRPENGNLDIYWVDAAFIENLRPY